VVAHRRHDLFRAIREGGSSGGIGGSLEVRGGAILTLTGANTCTGGTRVGDGVFADSGKLVVANLTGSGTGSGAVAIRSRSPCATA